MTSQKAFSLVDAVSDNSVLRVLNPSGYRGEEGEADLLHMVKLCGGMG